MKKGLNLEISSDLDYEGMVVNIVYYPEEIDFDDIEKKYYFQESIATLYQDKGIENIEIKLYPSRREEYLEFSYKEFIDILEEAKKLLIESNEKK